MRNSYYYEDREFNEYVNNNSNAIDDIDDSQSLFSFSSDNKVIKPGDINKLIMDKEECPALYEVLSI